MIDLEGYEILHPIGEGAMGQVYLARIKVSSLEVAIKILKAGDQESWQRFFREAEIMASLVHPNILKILEFGMTQEYLYIVMPYISGSSLQIFLENLPPKDSPLAISVIEKGFRWFYDLALAMDYFHQKGIIHRDIKPSNILLHNDKPLFADFGVAHIEESELTRTGQILGSPAYMAPEQFKPKEKITNKVDIYSLGTLFFQLFTGQHPFPGVGKYERIYKILHEPVPSVSSLCSYLIPEMDGFFEKALAKDPNQRFPTAYAMASALRVLWIKNRKKLLTLKDSSRSQDPSTNKKKLEKDAKETKLSNPKETFKEEFSSKDISSPPLLKRISAFFPYVLIVFFFISLLVLLYFSYSPSKDSKLKTSLKKDSPIQLIQKELQDKSPPEQLQVIKKALHKFRKDRKNLVPFPNLIWEFLSFWDFQKNYSEIQEGMRILSSLNDIRFTALPNSWQNIQKGLELYQKQNFLEGTEYFLQGLKNLPPWPMGELYLAFGLALSNEEELRAQELLKKIHSRLHSHPYYQLAYAKTLIDYGSYQTINHFLSSLPAKVKDNPYYYVILIDKKLRVEKDIPRAFLLVQKGLKKYPKSIFLQALKVSILFYQKKFGQVIQNCYPFLESPLKLHFYLYLGQALQKKGASLKGQRILEKGLQICSEIKSKYPPRRFYIASKAYFLKVLKKYTEGLLWLANISTSLSTTPSLAICIHYFRLTFFYLKNYYPEAQKEGEQALFLIRRQIHKKGIIDKYYIPVSYILCKSYIATKDWEKANSIISEMKKKGLDRGGNFSYQRCRIYLAQKKMDLALQHAERLYKAYPQNMGNFILLSNFYKLLNKKKKWLNLVRNKSSFYGYSYEVMKLEWEGAYFENNWKRIFELSRLGRKLYPKNPLFLIGEAVERAKAGKKGAGERLLKEALQLNPLPNHKQLIDKIKKRFFQE